MVLLLRHSGKIIGGRTSPTRERDDPVAPARKLRFADLGRDRLALPTIKAAGLPLLAASSASRFTFGCPREEKCFYRQTASLSNRAGTPTSPTAACFDRRLGRASSASGAGAIQISWLNADASRACVAKSTFCLIVTCWRSSRKLITGWCPNQNLGPRNSPAN
jgi:hypothetical protein